MPAYKIDLDTNGKPVAKPFVPQSHRRTHTLTPKPAKTSWRKRLQKLRK